MDHVINQEKDLVKENLETLYEQDTTDNNTLRNRWNALSNDEQEYILGQFGESRQDFEETFN